MTNETMTSTEVATETKTHIDPPLLEAAEVMSNFLAAAGVAVSPKLALQSINEVLGIIYGRKTSTGPQYLVNAIYTDNDQLYGGHVDADSPLAAAILTQIERLSDSGWITKVSVLEVVDRRTGKEVLVPGFKCDLDLLPLSEAIARTVQLAQHELGEPPSRGVEEAEAYDAKRDALQYWGNPCSKKDGVYVFPALVYDLDAVITDPSFDLDVYGSEPTTFTRLDGTEVEIDAVATLKTVLVMADLHLQKIGHGDDAKASGFFHYLQVRETLAFYEDRLAVVLNGYHF